MTALDNLKTVKLYSEEASHFLVRCPHCRHDFQLKLPPGEDCRGQVFRHSGCGGYLRVATDAMKVHKV